MEDRYQIQGKIAQGGLGSVYRAHDERMSRDVAIKRILTNIGDSSIADEATRQLIKEASALASLQHPNIVTIYDVGKDEEGPFVVMELLTGQTIEEIISNASFTWEDFRQLAMQSLEALIAAQELHIVHRDIKPSNIMLTWLPSGKFQVKVVDFGLAKLSTKPSLQTIDQSDGVFGSIYFMGPEQFERIPIDQRVDLYALGCVFYYALTGTYPFDGENAVEVMASHLQHHVTPIEEVRAGIPLWACNWIMWLINRQPADRPESARDALQIFMQNDSAYISPEMSTGLSTPAPPSEPSRRPKLFIPGAAITPDPVDEPKPNQSPKKTASVAKPLTPPQGSKPSVHLSPHYSQNPEPPAPEPEPEPEPTPEPTTPITPTPPQFQAPTLARPTRPTPTASALASPGLKPIPTGPALGTAPTQNAPTSSEIPPSEQPYTPPKKGISNSVKVMFAIVLSIVVVFMIFFILDRKRKNVEIALFNEMVLLAAKEDTTEVPVNKRKLALLLSNASSREEQKDRSAIYTALYLAKATDNTDVDKEIAAYATKQPMHKDIRVILLREVLAKRKNPAVIQTLLDYSKSSTEPETALAAIQACRPMASDPHFELFLNVLKNTTDERIRKAAEEIIDSIINKSTASSTFRSALTATYTNSPIDAVKHASLRLLARVGGDQALEFVKQSLNSPEHRTKVVALGALGNWIDSSGFNLLIEYVATETNPKDRALAFDAAIKYAATTEDKPEEAWRKINEQSNIQEDQIKLINALASYSADPWVFEIINKIAKTSDSPPAVERAKKAVAYLERMKKAQGETPKEDK